MRLSDRIYNFLSRRPEEWYHRFDLSRRAEQKGYSREKINAAFRELGDPIRFPDVNKIWISDTDPRPVIPGGYGEYWRVVPMDEDTKEIHRHAHRVFEQL